MMLVLRQLYAELRRRRVLRTRGLYIVGTWVVLQVADLAFDFLVNGAQIENDLAAQARKLAEQGGVPAL